MKIIGKTILHYKIVKKLGEGGMGVVYKAEDTKLERTVALKFLSQSLIGGKEENERFKREAKAAAALNHPNIATVFAIDEADDQTFIAMEFIEGKSIEEIVHTPLSPPSRGELKGGVSETSGRPLPLDDAINYATQIAAGLQAAHEKGVIHRDIKSANIMVTEKGVVKIMDFGLAKLSGRTKMTMQGTTLGTAAYMSPEQAQGQSVDHRSDIWSLGVVLYEMISGQMPFKGDYEQAVIYSIQNEAPEPLTAVRTGVPMDLEKIVNKLLAKDPRDRYQNIMELPVDLKAVTVQKTTASQVRSSGIRESILQEKKLSVEVKYSYKTILAIAASVIVTFLLTWIFKIGHPPTPEPKPPNKYAIPLPEDVNWVSVMAISANATNMVFRADKKLFLKRAKSFDAIELEGALARAPFFSPDGRWIGYFDGKDNEIYKILVDGGEPLQITSHGEAWHGGATWAPDNTIIFSGLSGGLHRVSASGGPSVKLTKTRGEGEWHGFPHLLPDGETVLFTVGHEGTELDERRLAIYRFGDDDYRVILDEEGYNAVYSATGHILYGRSDRLMAVPFDLKNLKISGLPAPVLDNVQTYRFGHMSYALSKEGTIIYVPGTGGDNDLRTVLNVDLSGKATELFDLKKRFTFARNSPDGKYVALRIEEENAANIWIYHVEGGAMNQLTFYKEGYVGWYAWSPDSKSIAYPTTAEDSTNSFYIRRSDGSGTVKKIYTSSSDATMSIGDWSADGDKLLFWQDVGNGDIFVYSFQDSSVKPFLTTPAFEGGPDFSPNGKWIVYDSNVSRGPSGETEVYVKPYPESSGGVWKISNGGGGQVVWSPDGKKIFYQHNNGMYSVDVDATNGFSKGNPKRIFEGNYFLSRGRRWDIHPHGDRFIMIQDPTRASAEEQKIFVIQNFDEELKRLVPTGKD